MKWKSYAVALLLFSLAGLLAVIPQGAFAQQVTAALTGKVSDASGAAIPNARVIATDVDRGSQFPTVTNDDGIFNLPRVPIGTYNLRVEASGFQPAQQNNIILDLNQTVRADFPLQVGNVSSSVDVTSAAPLLQTDTTEISTILNAKTNEELPLATRNYVQLTLLAPGSEPEPSSFKNGQTTGSSGRPYVNGNREQANNFILDGMDNNQVSDNLVGYAPSVDAIQEFNEITQNAPAEFGNFMGGIVSTHIKSGTNQFHGDVFEFFRNDVLNANTWSNNFNGAPRPQLRWNEFGGTFGGPIMKDKLFFFVDYQGQRFDTPTSTGATSVLTAQERQGNFSAAAALATRPAVQSVLNRAQRPTAARSPETSSRPACSIPVASEDRELAATIRCRPNGDLINNIFYTSHSQINRRPGRCEDRLERLRQGPHLRRAIRKA